MELNFELIDNINNSRFRGLEDYEVGSVLFWDINIDSQTQNHSVVRSLARILFSIFVKKYYGDVKEADLCFFYPEDYKNHNYKEWFNKVEGLFDNTCCITTTGKKLAFKGEILKDVCQWIRVLRKYFDFNTAVFYGSALAKHYSDLIDVRKQIDKCNPKVLTVVDGSHQLDHMVTQYAKMRNIKTVTLQHGVETEVDYAKCVICDYILVFGQQTYELYENIGYDLNRIKKVGMPRLIGKKLADSFTTDKNAIAVIMGAYPTQKDDVRMLSIVKSYAKKHGMKVMAKLHPMCTKEEYPTGTFDGIDEVIISEMSVEELMDKVDYATVTQSTVFLENLLECKPTFVCDCKDCIMTYENSKELIFDSVEDLEELINKAENNPQDMVRIIKETLTYYTEIEKVDEKYREFYNTIRD